MRDLWLVFTVGTFLVLFESVSGNELNTSSTVPGGSHMPDHLRICIVDADELPFYERLGSACDHSNYKRSIDPGVFRGFLIDTMHRITTNLRADGLTGNPEYYCVDPDHDTAIKSLGDEPHPHQPRCDIIVGTLVPTFDRTNFADFTHPYFFGGGVGIARMDTGHKSDQWGFLKPYTPLTWLWMLLLLICTEYFIMYGESGSNDVFFRRFRGSPMSKAAVVVMPLLRAFGALMNKGTDSFPLARSIYGKFHLTIVRFSFAILFVFYGSRVTANMVAENPRFFTVSDPEDMLGRAGNRFVGPQPSTVEHRMVSTQFGASLDSFLHTHKEMSLKFGQDGLKDKMLVWPYTQMTYNMRDRCDVDFSDGPIIPYSLALAVRTGLGIHFINQELLQLEQDGTLRQFQTRISSTVKNACSNTDANARLVTPPKSLLWVLLIPTLTGSFYLLMSLIFNSLSADRDGKMPDAINTSYSNVVPDESLFHENYSDLKGLLPLRKAKYRY